MTGDEVVVTGAGVITAAGADRTALLECALAGRCHVTPRTLSPCAGFPALGDVYAASLGPLPAGLLPARGARALGPEGRAFGCAAVLACREAGLGPNHGGLPAGAGVAVGTSWAGLDDYVQLFASGLAQGPGAVMPTQGPRAGFNAPAAQASILLGADGPNLTACTGNAAAADAIATAADLIRAGRAPVMLAGGIDLLSYFPVYAARSEDPRFATISDPRPFDRSRSGPAPGEAAVALVLERAASASARDRPTLARLLGAGSACVPALSRSGSRDAGLRAVTDALRSGGAAPADVDAVVAGADGSPGLDAVHAGVVLELFGTRVHVCSPHGAVGGCAGAGAAVQAALALAALGAGVIPPTCGFSAAEPALRELRVTTGPVRVPIRLIVTLSLDPGGHAAALLFGGPSA